MKFKDLKRKINRIQNNVNNKIDSVNDKLSGLESRFEDFKDPKRIIEEKKNELIGQAFKRISGLSMDNPSIAVKKYEVDTSPVTLQYPESVPPSSAMLEFRIIERNAIGDNIRKAITKSGVRAFNTDASKFEVQEGVDLNKTIKLFVPNGAIKTNYQLSYNETEKGIVTGILSNLKQGKTLTKATAEAVAQGAANKLVDGAASGVFGQFGLARNPNMEVLFTRPGFRAFNFTFQFVPRNERESESIRRIIKMFKEYSHPVPLDGDKKTNVFWKFPEVFEIKLVNDLDISGEKIPFKTKKCVLESLEATYENSEGKFEQYHDGHASQITLSLSFKEIVTLTRNDINDGY